MSVPPTEQIEVTDPTHPLYGLTLPCLGLTNKQHLGRVCVVWLAPGIERLVPVSATSLVGPPSSPTPCRLSVGAVEALLTVLVSAGAIPAGWRSQEDVDVSAPLTTSTPTAVATRPTAAAAVPAGRDAHHAIGPRPGARAGAAAGVDRALAARSGPTAADPHRGVAGGGPCP